MPVLKTLVRPGAGDFDANAAAMEVLVQDLRATAATVPHGGGPAARKPPAHHGNPLPRATGHAPPVAGTAVRGVAAGAWVAAGRVAGECQAVRSSLVVPSTSFATSAPKRRFSSSLLTSQSSCTSWRRAAATASASSWSLATVRAASSGWTR